MRVPHVSRVPVHRRRWQDLSPAQKVGLTALAIAELMLSTVAARDLAQRRPAQVRGPKPLWASVLLVQPVGPVAYLLLGRRG